MDLLRSVTCGDLIPAVAVAVAITPVAMSVLMQRHVIAGLIMQAVKG